MNPAIFASAFYPHTGGVEELCRQLARLYRRQGMDAIVLTSRWPPSLPEVEELEGIPVYRFPFRVPEGDLKARLKFQLSHGAIRRRILDTLKRHRSDILHVQCVSSNAYYALQAKEALGLPLVVTTQGERTMDAGRLYERSALMNRVLREALAKADYITACSRDTLDDVERFCGSPFGSRASVVYNGIALEDFTQGETFVHPRPYILGIGRMVSQKGFDLLIEAYAQSGIASHDLLLAGDGEVRPTLEKLVCDRNLSDRVRFLGRADRPMAVALFKGCSFFVLPSRREPQGIVNLEAMAAGKGVIAARVGGVPEIVLEGETGLLFPGEDVSALATLLARLADDPTERERLGRAGYARAGQFDWSAIGREYLGIYHMASEGR